MMIRKQINQRSVLALVLCSLVGAATCATPAAAASDPLPPAPIEVSSYMSQAGISKTAALQRLEAQRKLPELQKVAQDRLGDSFGGIWVDNDDHDRIKVAVAPRDGSGKPTDEDTRRAQQVIKDSGLSSSADIVEVPRSKKSITDLQARIDAELLEVNRDAPVTVDIEPDIKQSRLRLLVPAKLTDAQRKYVPTVISRFSPIVVQVTKTAPLQRFTCSGIAWCDPPLRGAIRLVYAGSGICSSGFVVRSLSDNIRYLSTAGHCLPGRSGAWNTHFANGSIHYIGAPHSYTTDFGILTINNPSGWNPGPYIRIHSSQLYRINSYGGSTVGQRVCHSGAYMDSNCGTVTYGLATRGGVPHTYRASVCSTPGNSGGPVFNQHRAHGSFIGYYGSGSCPGIYFGANYFWVLNVVPVI